MVVLAKIFTIFEKETVVSVTYLSIILVDTTSPIPCLPEYSNTPCVSHICPEGPNGWSWPIGPCLHRRSVVSSTTINLMQPVRQNPTDQSYHLHNNVSQSKYMYWWMIVYSFVGIKHNQSTIHLFPITLLWFYEYFDISVIFVTFTTTKLWSSQSNKNQSIN